jgi:hypothetical protein
LNKLHFKQTRFLFVFLFLLCIGIGFLLLRPGSVPQFVIVSPLSTYTPATTRSSAARWIPSNWTWVWRLKSALFGQPRKILLQASILEFNNPPDSFMTNFLGGGIELAATNDVRVFTFPPNELKNLRARLANLSGPDQASLQVVSSPRISTADGIGSSLSTSGSGTNQIPFSFQFSTLPQVRRGTILLTTTILLTETIAQQTTTNLALWAEARIADANGLLLLHCQPSSGTNTNTNTKPTAILISCDFAPLKKTTHKP